MLKLTQKAICYGRTDGLTDPNYRKALLLKRIIWHLLLLINKNYIDIIARKKILTARALSVHRINLYTI